MAEVGSGRRRLGVGDVFEVSVPEGLHFVQYVDTRAPMGDVVRVFTGRFAERPRIDWLHELIAGRASFLVYLDVSGNERRGDLAFVASIPVPPLAAEDRWRFPAGRDGGRVVSWWVKDGATKRIVTSLTADDRTRSIASVIGIATLRRALRTGWTQENYDGNGPWQGPHQLAEEETRTPSRSGPPLVEHLVFFGDADSAGEFAQQAATFGFDVDAHESGNEEWAVVLTAPYVEGDALNLPAALRETSDRLGGVYDGTGVSRGT